MPKLANCHDARSASNEAALTTDSFESALMEATETLKRYAMRLYHDPVASEDAVQETLCRALENRHAFTLGTNMCAWLATIMRNAFCSERKSAAAKHLDYKDESDYADHIEAPENPERSLIVKQSFNALATLKTHIADALIFSGKGYTLQEMAATFGIGQNTLKSHITRGRAQLAGLTGGL
jgi:RNA polymerase sigma-70 factor (ECF subfamily)